MENPHPFNALKGALHQQGFRMTPQRNLVMALFQQLPKGEHLSADEVHLHLLQEQTPLSLSTVYRTLHLMSKMGILRELELAEDHKHYEINAQEDGSHHHLVCIRCTKTIEFTSDTMQKIGEKVAKGSGFSLLDCQLVIHALCPSCQRS
jgi:Fur family transcriptional regulator, ferric uptake regulator